MQDPIGIYDPELHISRFFEAYIFGWLLVARP